jgi:hypothetical protein
LKFAGKFILIIKEVLYKCKEPCSAAGLSIKDDTLYSKDFNTESDTLDELCAWFEEIKNESHAELDQESNPGSFGTKKPMLFHLSH